jgi:hypothetical protein
MTEAQFESIVSTIESELSGRDGVWEIGCSDFIRLFKLKAPWFRDLKSRLDKIGDRFEIKTDYHRLSGDGTSGPLNDPRGPLRFLRGTPM